MAHKTFSGMVRAVDRICDRLDSGPIDNDHDYQAFNKQVSELLRELDALWSNPADAAEASRLKNQLLDAWHAATA